MPCSSCCFDSPRGQTGRGEGGMQLKNCIFTLCLFSLLPTTPPPPLTSSSLGIPFSCAIPKCAFVWQQNCLNSKTATNDNGTARRRVGVAVGREGKVRGSGAGRGTVTELVQLEISTKRRLQNVIFI